MPTMKDVARHAGVGVGTVSRTLNRSGYVDVDTRARVMRAVDALGYRPNAVARALRRQQTGTVGFIVPDLRNQFYNEASSVLQAVLDREGAQLLVGVSGDSPEGASRCFQAFRDQRVDAIVSIPAADGPPPLGSEPVVEMNRRSASQHLDAVISDDTEGVAELTRILTAAGHRRIAFLCGDERLSTSQARRRGFDQAMDATPDAEGIALSGDYSAAWGRDAARQALARGATGIIAASSTLMEGVAQHCQRERLSAPHDFSAVSLGDPAWFDFWQAGVTTFAPDLAGMGEQTALRVLARINEPSPSAPTLTIVPGRLITRGSVGPPTRHPTNSARRG